MDTSSLVRSWSEAYPPDHFPTFWKYLEALIAANRLIAPDEVLHELKRRDDDLHEWARKRSSMFVPIDDEVQINLIEIMSRFEFLVKARTGKSGGDPWVIALAKFRGATVVTEERPTGSPKNPKIPDVCNHYGIDCVNVLQLIKNERWVFGGP